MEFISGLLLTLVVLGIIALVAREMIGERGGETVRKYLGDSPAAGQPMIGKRGTVLASSGDTMRVRIEGESWSANLAGGDATLPANSPVRVAAVNGLVLEVEEVADTGEVAADVEAADVVAVDEPPTDS